MRKKIKWLPLGRDAGSYEARRALDLMNDWLENYGASPAIEDCEPDGWAKLDDGRLAFRVDISGRNSSVKIVDSFVFFVAITEGKQARCTSVELRRTL